MNDQPENGEGNRLADRVRDLSGRLSPRTIMSDGRVLLAVYAVVFLVTSILLFPPARKSREIRFREGDVADTDVIAPFTFDVPLSDQEIEINRAKAAVGVPPVYRYREEATVHLPDDLRGLIERIARVADIDTLPPEDKVGMIRELAPALEKEPVELLLDGRLRRRMLEEGLAVQRRLLDRGIINDSSPLRRRDYPHIRLIRDGEEELIPSSPLIDQAMLEEVILERARTLFRNSDDARQLFYSLVRSHLMPNIIYDPGETNLRREEAKSSVEREFRISENERIVAKHDKVTQRQVDILQALERNRTRLELSTSHVKMVMLFFGKILRMVLLLSVFFAALYRFDRDLLLEPGKSTLTFIVMMSYLLITALILRISALDPYLVPVAFVALVSTAFFGTMSAVIFTLFASLMLVTHTSLPAGYVFVSVLAGTAAIYSIAQLRERKNFYTIFLYVSLAYIIGIASFSASEGLDTGEFLASALWGITNSFVCTVLVMFLLPIFESLFDVTTNFTLMELSDLNRPILKRLIIEAPGTYHHSLMVGNMVEAVASDVGANGLLARVSAYYHDIGKLAKPGYFFENKGENFNKHEKLAPTMSALILTSHVKEGADLARKEKLPRVIIDGIREHHGTTVMAYFYNKALEYDSHDSVNIDDFRYSGPRPRSKETALIMLADSCEAAVRSLKEPTTPRIRALVTRIFESRMNDGELDHSGLTLDDIAVIREKFITFLTGIFHPRIQYPSQEEERKEEEQSGEDQRSEQAAGEGKREV